MRWYAVLFWLWLLGSLVVLVVRRSNRSATPPSTGERVDPLLKEWAPPPVEPGPVPTAAVVAATTADDPGEPATGDADTDADVEPDSGPTVSPTATPSDRATLAELLAGITLPHELVPLTQFDATGDLSSHVVVATNRASAEMVGTGLADELERLGFTVTSTGQDTAVAEGPRGRLSMVIHPDGSVVVDGGVQRFPTAASGTVVVELRAQ